MLNHDATTFCLGSFRDALWLRCKSFSARRAFSLDSPLRCVSLLGTLAFLSYVFAFGLPSRRLFMFLSSPQGRDQFALRCFWLYLESLLVLLTLNPLPLGEYPANRFAPSLVIRLRRWLFLSVKIALLPPIICFAVIALMPIFPPAPLILFLWLDSRTPLGTDGSATTLPILPPFAHQPHQNRQPSADYSWLVWHRTHLHSWPRITLRSGSPHELL